MIDLRLPNITGKTEAEQIVQVKSYLNQLVGELNWALNTVESYQSGNTSAAVVYNREKDETPQNAEETFNSIKALIIKSADIVKAYEETITSNFKGKYFADSDFGTYVEETSRTVVENSKYVNEIYENVQSITNKDGTGSLDNLAEDVRKTNAYIKRGLLSDGEYGIEIGETTEDGVFRHYAQFTSDKLTFFDVNKNPVAYIGAGDANSGDTNCLYVTGKAVFQGEVNLYKYKVDTSDGLAFTWIG